MSTKIFNGYKFKDQINLHQLQEFTLELRKEFYTKTVEKLESEIACQATAIHDIHKIYGDHIASEICGKLTGDSFILNAWFILCEYFREMKKLDYNEYFAQVVYIPIIKDQETVTLILFYTHDNTYTDLWETNDKIEEYMYYDNTDAPEDISEEDWDQRRKDWEIALPYASIPSMRGLTATLINEIPFIRDFKEENIRNKIPNLSERVENIVDKIMSFDTIKTPEEFSEYRRTDVYKARRNELKHRLEKKLKNIDVII